MSRIVSTCDECGRAFLDDAAEPRLWCSVYCETQPARFAAVEARGAAAERAAVVAWLREKANAEHPIERGVPSLSPVGRGLLLLYADHIESGAHIGATGGAR